MDNKLVKLARRHHLIYTRYADDISFSTTKKEFPKEIATFEGQNPITGKVVLSKSLTHEIEISGFKVNTEKTRLQIPCIRQEVTGITVNEFPNVPRKFIRNIRAMIFAWKKFGLVNAEKEYISKYSKHQIDIPEESLNGEYYKNVLYGKLAYLKMIRGAGDHLYINYCLDLAKLDNNPPRQIREAKEMHEIFDVFICHASEDKEEIARPVFEGLLEKEITTFLDEKYIKWGNSFIEKINHALGKAKYVIAIISKYSIDKAWPVKEINAALAREINGKQKILPLMVGDAQDIETFQDKIPLINDKKYLVWSNDVSAIINEVRGLLTT